MRKAFLGVSIALITLFGCKDNFDKAIDTPEENSVINDSIHKIPSAKLPESVKGAFQQVFISEQLAAKPSESSFEFLESEAIIISKKGGITNYSIQVKKGTKLETFLKHNNNVNLTAKSTKDCNSVAAGGSQPSRTIEMISINIADDGRIGDPTRATYNNYGQFIESSFTNLNNGNHFNTWIPNPAYGGDIGHVSESSGRLDGHRRTGGFLRDAWGRIISLKDQIHRYIRNVMCGCSHKKPVKATNMYDDFDIFKDCNCNDGDYELNHDFSTILPESFFEYDKNFFKNKDCECLYEQLTEDNDTDLLFFEKVTYLECSCQKNETGGVALFLNLSANEKEFLEKHRELNSKICEFLGKDNTQIAINFAKEAVKAVMQGGEVNFKERLILTADFINNPRLKCIYTRFYRGNNSISNYLKSFLKDGDSPKGNLKFTIANNFGERFEQSGGATAVAVPPDKNNVIEIAFNTDPNAKGNIMNTSTILVGFSLIHEVVHTEIYSKLLECRDLPYVNRGNLTDPEWKELLKSMLYKFPDMYKIYKWYNDRTNIPNESQHEYMAQKYVSSMAKALADFDKNQHTKEFYEDIGWVGLQNSESFKKKFSADLNAFHNFTNSLNQAKNETKGCTN